jgi:hypothetical protein
MVTIKIVPRVWAAAILLLTTLAIAESSAIAVNECPHFGASTDCGTIITIRNIPNPQGPATLEFAVSHNLNQPPYDQDISHGWAGDDTLVGVVNSSSLPIRSIRLRSAHPIFGEDFGHSPSDGICGTSFYTGLPFTTDATVCPSGPQTLLGNPYTLTGYEGPSVFFANLTSTEGTVIFEPPILPGGKRYFGLEAAISAAVSCPEVINNTIQAMIGDYPNKDGTKTPKIQMNITFTTGLNPTTSRQYTLSQVAEICGFKRFNWISKMTVPNPSPYFEHLSFPTNTTRLNPYNNSSPGNPNPPNTTSPRLTKTTGPFNDPPKYGKTNKEGTEVSKDWYSYPFYWDMRPETDIQSTDPPYWLLSKNSTETTLSFKDAPTDHCLPTGVKLGTPIPIGCDGYADPNNVLGFTTHLAGVLDEVHPKGVDLGIGYTWTSSYNGSAVCTTATGTHICAASSYSEDLIPDSGTGGITITGIQNLTNYNYNGIVVTTINDAPTGRETTPPAIMVSANPMKLWPPNHRMVPVTVSGTITDNEPGGTGVNPSTAAYVVTDEYGLVQPTGTITLGSNGSYSFTIQLQASRKGDDKDGRQYLLTVSAEDFAGLKGSSSTLVIVPHNQRHDRKHHRKHDREDDREHDQRDDQDHDERDDRRH